MINSEIRMKVKMKNQTLVMIQLILLKEETDKKAASIQVKS